MDLKERSFIQKFLTQPRAGRYYIWAPQRLMKLMMTSDTVRCVLEFIIVVLFLMPVYLNVFEDFGGTWGGWLFVLKIIFIFLSLLNGGLDNDWIWGLFDWGWFYIVHYSLKFEYTKNKMEKIDFSSCFGLLFYQRHNNNIWCNHVMYKVKNNFCNLCHGFSKL